MNRVHQRATALVASISVVALAALTGIVSTNACSSTREQTGSQLQELIEAGSPANVASFGFNISAARSGRTLVAGYDDLGFGFNPRQSEIPA